MKTRKVATKATSNLSSEHNKSLQTLTLIAAFLSCAMLFVSVYYYVESIRLTKRNNELEILSIQLEGEVSRLRDKRMLDAINSKKQDLPARINTNNFR